MKRMMMVMAALGLVAGSAEATPLPSPFTLIGGWDHAQYLGANAPTIDGTNLATQVPANHSDFDPTGGAGSEAAAFGDLYLSSNGATVGGGAIYIPTSNQFTLGFDLPQNDVPMGDEPFNAFNRYAAEMSQPLLPAQNVSMLASESVSVVYGSRLGTGLFGENYRLDLVGLTLGGASTVTVDVSVDGSTYVDGVASFELGATESEFVVDLGTALDGAQDAFVRLNLPQNAVLDNVGVSAEVVPEPGTLVLLGAGLAGLAGVGRFRRA